MNDTNARPEDPKKLRELVSESYGNIAKRASENPGGAPAGAAEAAQRIGYEADQLDAIPEGANLGVGCGNPTAIDALRPGEVVVDLGCGAGMDSFLAARAVGPEGRVIGINVAAIPPTPDTRAVSIGFAIPSTTVIPIVEQLLESGEARHARLGIEPANLTPEVAEEFEIERDGGGIVVISLVPGGAAERAGLQAEDLIVGFDGVPVRIVEDIFSTLSRYQPGDEVTLTIIRDGAENELQLLLADETGS